MSSTISNGSMTVIKDQLDRVDQCAALVAGIGRALALIALAEDDKRDCPLAGDQVVKMSLIGGLPFLAEEMCAASNLVRNRLQG